MGYMTDGLTFNVLRGANIERVGKFKNKKGEVCHLPDGSDWSESQWLEALVGELGEYANLHKKMSRGDITREEALPELAKELADVQIYLDLLAFRLGINLGQATIDKFNEVSYRVGVEIYLHPDGWHAYP